VQQRQSSQYTQTIAAVARLTALGLNGLFESGLASLKGPASTIGG
jgi:hypothetical protein